MTVVSSDDIILTSTVPGLSLNNPIVGYDNIVTIDNIASITENTNFPITNLANNNTSLKWKAELGSPSLDEEYIIVTNTSNEPIDYVAIAGHNFGTGKFPVSIEGLSENLGSPQDWIALSSEVTLGNDNPVIFRFTSQFLSQIRIRIQASNALVPPAAQAAVVYVGQLLVLQRRIHTGHTPLPYGRSSKVVNARSESGNFLGRIQLNESVQTSVDLNNLTPDWYREYMNPWFINAQENPFFFNWRPQDYPYESGFAWLTDNPQPNNSLNNGFMSVSFSMTGIV